MDNYYSQIVSEETFAAWLDGTMSYEQESMFLDACSNNKDLQELLEANDHIDEDYENMIEIGYNLPYEFSSDFEIPPIDNINESDELYSYEQIEPYEQENDNTDDLMDHGDAESEDETIVDNCTLTDMDSDGFDLI